MVFKPGDRIPCLYVAGMIQWRRITEDAGGRENHCLRCFCVGAGWEPAHR